MVEVRPATPDMFERVLPLLQEFPGQNLSSDLWRRMLFDPPWPVEEPHRGYVLVDRDEIVGFCGAMFSRRRLRWESIRFCNLSSWIVRETHRAHSLQLLRPVLALEGYVIVSPSPNAVALPIYLRLGFRVLEDSQWLIAPLPGPGQALGAVGTSIVTRPGRIRDRLDAAGREIHDHLRGSVAREALAHRGDRSCHVVATASPWKGRWRLAHVRYASDWGLFWDHTHLFAAAFFRLMGTVGLRVDGRHATGARPSFAVRRPLTLPPLYIPGPSRITPDQVDGLYSEGLFQPW